MSKHIPVALLEMRGTTTGADPSRDRGPRKPQNLANHASWKREKLRRVLKSGIRSNWKIVTGM
jgi:hypothetical protein